MPATLTAGSYTLKLAVLTAGWSTIYWDNGASSFAVSASGASKPTAPTSPTTPTTPPPATTPTKPTAPVVSIPSVPGALTAAPGNAKVSLSWSASGNATSYHVKRATT